MKKPTVFCLLMIILTLMVGCQPTPTEIVVLASATASFSPTTAPAFTDTPIPATATMTLSPTPTVPPPTQTRRPTLTPTHTPDMTIFGNIGGGMMAYVSSRDGDNEIYLQVFPQAEGESLVEIQLTDNEDDDVLSDWSPDGKNIVFSSDRDGNMEIYVMNVETALQNGGVVEVQRLTNHEGDDMLPAWSPDGSQIAFSSDHDGDLEIFVMNADGTNLRQLTSNSILDSKPSWSPDGTKIVFDSGGGYNRDIYIMDADGSNPQLITEAEGGWPDWSPDGTQIAFFGRLAGNPEIYTVNVDGSNRTRMTVNNIDDWEPSWLPDGEWLLYTSGAIPNIFLMHVDRSEIYQLTHDQFGNWVPLWRPLEVAETTSDDLESTPSTADVNDLRLTIIYDNTAFDERLTPEWGFGILVKYGEHTILFDTGGSDTFMENMHILDINPRSIEAVVLSHEHGDHTGGLLGFLDEAEQPVVYVPKDFSWGFKRMVSARTELVEVTSAMEIFPDIYSTGQIFGGGIYEQGLAIDLGEEIVVITGCAHPGVVRMTRAGISAVQPGTDTAYKPVALVIGGFHLMNASRDEVEGIIENLSELGVKQVSPTHCTGDETIAVFSEILGNDYVPGGAGQIIEITGGED
jgi:TolB protein